MREKRLIRYLFFSTFVHIGVLVGFSAFLKPPPAVIPVDLVPTQTVVLEEESIPSLPKPTITGDPLRREAQETKSQRPTRSIPRPKFEDAALPHPKETTLDPPLLLDQTASLGIATPAQEKENKTLEIKSQVSAGTETRLNVRDLAGPIPKEGSFEPSLNVDSFPELGVLPSRREGKEVQSKPIVSSPQIVPLRLSPVEPSRLDEPPPLKVEMPQDLIEAETGGVESYSQTQKKVETPIGRSREATYAISELPPIPTVESPSIPEQEEMILASAHNLPQERLARSETPRQPQPVAPPAVASADEKEIATAPQLILPKEEMTRLPLTNAASFPVPGSAEGAAFLFVLDTSGSVEGAPLEGIKKSAWEFLGLMGPNDLAGIMTFNDTVELIRPFTSEKKLLKREISNVRTMGTKTVLFDALTRGIDRIQKEDRKRKFVILFSDGKDEGSHSTLQDVIPKLRRSGVSILCVGYSRVEKEYLDTLREIAEETGGISADAPQFYDIVMLYKAAKGSQTQERTFEMAVRAVLVVTTMPTGAYVFVDGTSKGKTPLQVELPLGKHEVVLTLPEYHEWEAQVDLSKEGETPLLVRLLPID